MTQDQAINACRAMLGRGMGKVTAEERRAAVRYADALLVLQQRPGAVAELKEEQARAELAGVLSEAVAW